MILNQGQEEAISEIFGFLFSDQKEFVLSGAGGTGKTFLMRYVFDNLVDDYMRAAKLLGEKPKTFTMHFTATTNKAAEVLSKSIDKDTTTLHSFLGLKVIDDFRTGTSRISKTGRWTVYSNILLFVDESSMIDNQLHKFLHEALDDTCKIIYVGDSYQLAPVFEDISPAFKDPKNLVQLVQPVRNANQPALMNLCARLRTTVETNEFFPIEPVPGVIDYLTGEEAQKFIDESFKVEDTENRILCFTNDRVIQFNTYIRNLRNYPDRFVHGERLVCNSAVTINDKMIFAEQDLLVTGVKADSFTMIVDENDQNSAIDAYSISIRTSTGKTFNVFQPVDRERLKILQKYYADTKNWRTFYGLKNKFPDLRQKDASTVYKAQGSTYDTVLVDLNDLGRCKKKEQLARMLYVAASRPKNRLCLYGKLPDRLFKKA